MNRTMMPLVVLCFVSGLAVGAPRPNIILIVTDDQRPDTIHALGNAIIQTPELDKLAARSFVFTRAYATYPICHVSRAQILTGCPAFRALPQYPAGAIDPKLATLPRTLQTAGYVTWYSGKWHNDGQPKARGYTATRGLYSSGAGKGAPVQPSHDARGRPLTGYRGWTFKTDDGRIELDKGVGLQPDNSRHIAEGAIQALRDTPRDQPFFLHVNFAFPHDPRQWPAGAEGQYRADQMPLPANFAPVHPFDHGNLQGRDELLLPMPREPDAVREELALYYAMISDVDRQIGRLIETLESLGLSQNTVIAFTSDQGLALGSHGLLGKQNQYEHSIRSPLFLAGPGIGQGRSEALVCLYDLFPTFCDLAGIPVPASVEGLSLTPLLRAEKSAVREFVVGAFTDTQRMICDRTWKLVVYPRADRVQLFHLLEDRDEQHDLSQMPAHREQRDRLWQRLKVWCQEHGDPSSPTRIPRSEME